MTRARSQTGVGVGVGDESDDSLARTGWCGPGDAAGGAERCACTKSGPLQRQSVEAGTKVSLDSGAPGWARERLWGCTVQRQRRLRRHLLNT